MASSTEGGGEGRWSVCPPKGPPVRSGVERIQSHTSVFTPYTFETHSIIREFIFIAHIVFVCINTYAYVYQLYVCIFVYNIIMYILYMYVRMYIHTIIHTVSTVK